LSANFHVDVSLREVKKPVTIGDDGRGDPEQRIAAGNHKLQKALAKSFELFASD
jgi:hypothetical protein